MLTQSAMSNRRFLVFALAAISLILFLSIFFERQSQSSPTVSAAYISAMHPGEIVLSGEAIAGKLGNETAKYVALRMNLRFRKLMSDEEQSLAGHPGSSSIR